MDVAVLEELVRDLVGTAGLLIVVGSNDAVGEMRVGATVQVTFKDGWANIEAEGWHIHLNMEAVEAARFVEAEDHGGNIPEVYYVLFSDAQGKALVRFYFPNPWLDSDEKPTQFQPEKLRLFEGFRDRYAGRGGVVFSKESRRGSH